MISSVYNVGAEALGGKKISYSKNYIGANTLGTLSEVGKAPDEIKGRLSQIGSHFKNGALDIVAGVVNPFRSAAHGFGKMVEKYAGKSGYQDWDPRKKG